MERFILTEDIDVDMPAGKQHFAKGTPVAFSTFGMTYHRVKDKLRHEGENDQRGQAAVVLDRVPPRPGGHAAGLRN